jgi:hypothetical protein
MENSNMYSTLSCYSSFDCEIQKEHYSSSMIYFIVTASVFNSCKIREEQYKNGITTLKNMIKKNNINEYKIIIVENNGERNTFLNDLDCEVFYTTNNTIPTNNKGIKELQDVVDCIEKYNINDSDFIVKMTGRYILHLWTFKTPIFI